MTIQTMLPLVASGAAATGAAAKSVFSKDAGDFENEVPRFDLGYTPERANNGHADTYRRYDSATGKYYDFIDRGNVTDQWAALNDPHSERYNEYELGGRTGFADQLINALGSKADELFAMQGDRAELGADRYYASKQQGLLDAYTNSLAGNGPSVAAIAGNSALDANARNMLAARSVGSIADQRQAMLGGLNNGMSAGAKFAAQRSNEAFQAGHAATGLSGAMANSAISNAERQTKLDLNNRSAADALAMNYLGQQKSIRDSQFEAGNTRAADMITADKLRKDEVLAGSEQNASSFNKKVSSGVGTVMGLMTGIGAAASASKSSGGSDK